MAVSDDFLSKKIEDLAITTQNIPFSNTDHRRVADLVKSIKATVRLAKELETNLGVQIVPFLQAYIGMTNNE